MLQFLAVLTAAFVAFVIGYAFHVRNKHVKEYAKRRDQDKK